MGYVTDYNATTVLSDYHPTDAIWNYGVILPSNSQTIGHHYLGIR